LAAGAAAVLVLLLDPGARDGAPETWPPLQSRRVLVLGGLAAGIGGLAVAAAIERATRSTARGVVQAARRLSVSRDPAFEATPGLSPLITPPNEHYLIDINLTRPVIDESGWTLTIRGEVERETSLVFADLMAMGPEERAIHLQCISNRVGGNLAGNAAWSVLPLAGVLATAGPLPSARSVRVHAFDGYHESYTMESVAEIHVALAMGGLEIPDDHGSPVRLLYPGHYGMRSIKWLTAIEVLAEDRSENRGYWQKRGWDDLAPLKVGSRIDTPKSGMQPGRRVAVAGVAWGPRQVTRVEVSVDDGRTWPFAAEIEPPPDEHSWVRWKADIDLEPGSYDVRARAIAGDLVQSGEPSEPHPSGATGYDLRIVKIA
jgi:DMSO/TMAO reductase YedYZ molybdopterin-dependent catalytic subunit